MKALYLLAAFIFSRACYDAISTSFEWDEYWIFSKMLTEGARAALFPFSFDNQALGFLPAVAGLKVIGEGKLAVRLGAVLTTGILLTGLLFFAKRHLNLLGGILLLGLVATNAKIGWYAHSFRGYIALITTTFFILFYVLPRLSGEKFHRGILFSLLVLPIFAHSFGGIFSLAIIGTLIFWEFPAKKASMSYWSLPAALVIVSIMKFQSKAVEQANRDVIGTPSFEINILTALFGFPYDWVSVLFLGLLVFLLIFGPKTKLAKFLILFEAVHIVVTAALFLYMQRTHVASRYLLAHVLPFYLLMIELARGVQPKLLKIGLCSVFVFFMIQGEIARPWVIEGYTGHHPYEDFIRAAKERTNAPHHCYEFSGNVGYAAMSKYVFFPKNGDSKSCPNRYLLHFGIDSFDHSVDPPYPPSKLEMILDAPMKKKVYRVKE